MRLIWWNNVWRVWNMEMLLSKIFLSWEKPTWTGFDTTHTHTDSSKWSCNQWRREARHWFFFFPINENDLASELHTKKPRKIRVSTLLEITWKKRCYTERGNHFSPHVSALKKKNAGGYNGHPAPKMPPPPLPPPHFQKSQKYNFFFLLFNPRNPAIAFKQFRIWIKIRIFFFWISPQNKMNLWWGRKNINSHLKGSINPQIPVENHHCWKTNEIKKRLKNSQLTMTIARTTRRRMCGTYPTVGATLPVG